MPKTDEVKLSDVLLGKAGVFTIPNAQVHITNDGEVVSIAMYSPVGHGKEELIIPSHIFRPKQEAPAPEPEGAVQLMSHWMLDEEHCMVLGRHPDGKLMIAPGKGGEPLPPMTEEEFLKVAIAATPEDIGGMNRPMFLEFEARGALRRFVFGYASVEHSGRFFLPRSLAYAYGLATATTPSERNPFLPREGELATTVIKAGSREVEGYWMALRDSVSMLPLERCHASMGAESLEMLRNAIKPDWVDLDAVLQSKSGPGPFK